MALNFPSSPTEGQLFTLPGGKTTYRFTGGVWKNVTGNRTALPFNYIINPAMQHSQENGDTASTALNYYMADQWFGESPAPNLTWSRSPIGSGPKQGNRYIRGLVSVAIPSLTAANTLSFQQRLEGQRVADFRWGTVDARQVIVRFWVATNKAGDYCVALRNGNAAGHRTHLAPFTVTVPEVNTWKEVILVIPGDTGGGSTWLTDTSVGLQLVITFATGTTFQGVAGWQAGSFRALATTTNGLDTVNNAFNIADVGLYLDPANTGIPPEWEAPDYQQSLWECQRYYELIGVTAGASITPWAYYNWQYKAEKRASPALTIVAGAANGVSYAPNTLATTSFRQAAAATAVVDQRILANARM